MLGEGVSINRLKYRIHATNIRAPLSFIQDLGRLLRKFPKDKPEPVETLIPAHPQLIRLALDVMNEIAHVVEIREENNQTLSESTGEEQEGDTTTTNGVFQPLSSTGEFGSQIVDGQEIEELYTTVAEWAFSNHPLGKGWGQTAAHLAQVLKEDNSSFEFLYNHYQVQTSNDKSDNNTNTQNVPDEFPSDYGTWLKREKDQYASKQVSTKVKRLAFLLYPNGLETTIETIDRLLEAETDVQWMFRTIIYEASERQRDDSGKYTSLPEGSDCPLDLSERQQKNIRAANRAGEAIPEVRELLDRGLIAIDVAAKLGRDIKDTNNLTAEEREYIDKRDLIGVRIRQYINTNTIPEDEDQEPAYSRKLNRYVKDLLGIKDRSKSVRMDNPKMAAKKLLEFYNGNKLKQLIEILQEGLQKNQTNPEVDQIDEDVKIDEPKQQEETVDNESLPDELDSQEIETEINKSPDEENEEFTEEEVLVIENQSPTEELPEDKVQANQTESPISSTDDENDQTQTNTNIIELTKEQLARRLNVVTGTLQNAVGPRRIALFPEWTKNKDPDGIAWRRTRKKDDTWYFSPLDNNH